MNGSVQARAGGPRFATTARGGAEDLGTATRYGRALLDSVGLATASLKACNDRHPALVWAESGAMALTGHRDGPPLLAPGPLASSASGTLAAISSLAAGCLDHIDGAALLGERAAILGLERRGAISPGGSCRLLESADGWLTVNLARPDDVGSIGAWMGDEPRGDVWDFLSARLRTMTSAEALERACLLGLAVAAAGHLPIVPPPWHRVLATGRRRDDGRMEAGPGPYRRYGAAADERRSSDDRPLVIDLSSLWAGPLCTQLLSLAGARVIKVESSTRPDGARAGSAAFFDLMNGGKESVVLDLSSLEGRRILRRLIESADAVVESSRPRALEQMGIDARKVVRSNRGLTWLSLTGYGRSGDKAMRVAFGDDAAAAAGLAQATAKMAGLNAPLFCGDAIADPLAGLHAALALLAYHRKGGGVLVDVNLRDVTAHAACFPADCRAEVVRVGTGDNWQVTTTEGRGAILPPRVKRA